MVAVVCVIEIATANNLFAKRWAKSFVLLLCVKEDKLDFLYFWFRWLGTITAISLGDAEWFVR